MSILKTESAFSLKRKRKKRNSSEEILNLKKKRIVLKLTHMKAKFKSKNSSDILEYLIN